MSREAMLAPAGPPAGPGIAASIGANTHEEVANGRLAGPFSESDDAERSTNACGSITEVGSITPNAALSEYATGPGDYTLNGTEDELVSVLTMLGKSPEMVGNLNMDVSLNANNGNFLGGDSTESVEVTLTLLIFQPSGMTPTG